MNGPPIPIIIFFGKGANFSASRPVLFSTFSSRWIFFRARLDIVFNCVLCCSCSSSRLASSLATCDLNSLFLLSSCPFSTIRLRKFIPCNRICLLSSSSLILALSNLLFRFHSWSPIAARSATISAFSASMVSRFPRKLPIWLSRALFLPVILLNS